MASKKYRADRAVGGGFWESVQLISDMQSNEKASKRLRARVLPAAVVTALIFFVHCCLRIASSSYSFYGTFSLDLRSLAAGRILLGGIVLKDLVSFRFSVVEFMYTGFWKRKYVMDEEDPQIQVDDFSPYLAVGGVAGMKSCFGLVGLAAVTMMVGWHTQVSVFICWFHTRAVHLRSSGTAQAGDQLLRLILFWMIFLPCDKNFSVDSRYFPTTGEGLNSDCSIASFGLMLQIAIIYQFSSMFKVHEKWKSGTAVYYVLQNFGFAYGPVAQPLLALPRIFLSVLTHATVVVETVCPLFMFLTPYLRGLGAITFIGFHAGLYFSMRLGSFPLICISAWVMMLPSIFWDDANVFSRPSIVPKSGASWDVFLVSTFIQLSAIFFTILCNVNTLPQVHNSALQTLKLSERGYKAARALGMQQQWFLFDKPMNNSFWFRIVGHLKDSSTLLDLHQVMIHRNDKDDQEYEIKYAPFTGREMRRWAECYTSHRWRKLYQRLADKGNRYKPFQSHFAESLVELWNASKYRGEFGTIKRVSCIGVWTKIPDMHSQESMTTEWVPPFSAEAWVVDMDKEGRPLRRSAEGKEKKNQ